MVKALAAMVVLASASLAHADDSTPTLSPPRLVGEIGFNLTRQYDRPRTTANHIVPVASATGERAMFGLAGRF